MAAVEDGARLVVRVAPRGGRDALEGVVVDAAGRAALRVRVAAPPDDGAANAAVIKLIAKTAGVPKSAVRIESGQTSRLKRLRLAGDPDAIAAALGL